MGKQARLKRERREGRELVAESDRLGDTPIRLLRGLHKTIQGHCGESSRRCWEYLLEMLAHATGWPTESDESKHLWDKMADETRWAEFAQSWIAEVEWAKRHRAPFSEPLGQLLEEIEGTNSHLGQFMTPMPIVRMMNEITISDDYIPPSPDGMPGRRAIDPSCGTGRFMIDALIHDDGVLMHGVDLDVWMLRTAMMNVRLLARWTSLRIRDPDMRLDPLRKARSLINSLESAKNLDGLVDQTALVNPFSGMHEKPDDEHHYLLIGGRSIFMNGDALVVDLSYKPNWLCGGWAWSPRPWRGNIKIAGYYGTYDQWEAAGSPPLGDEERGKDVQFDYSMSPKQPTASP
jgi:predicted RNA methylase